MLYLKLLVRTIQKSLNTNNFSKEILDKRFVVSCLKGQSKLVDLYLGFGANHSWALGGACRTGHLDVVKKLINAGFRVTNGCLVGASSSGHLMLLKKHGKTISQ